MKSPIINFDPYTAPNGLHSLRSLRKFARRIKTRALRAGVLLVAPVALLFYPVGCEPPDDRRTVVQRHGTVETSPVEVRP